MQGALGKASPFDGERLWLARTFAGFTQAELAEKAGCTQAFIAQLEAQTRAPTHLLTAALAEVLGFERCFFTPAPFEAFRDEQCHFRRRASTPLVMRSRALAHGTLFGIFVARLEGLVELPSRRVPTASRPSSRLEIERAAEGVRVAWGLGVQAPVANLVRALERAGVVVTEFEGVSAKIDAFSRTGVERDIVVVNTMTGSTSRFRYDVAHELGHLVMHGSVPSGDAALEDDANAFAGAFLLPRAGFAREFPRTLRVDWDVVFRLKERWRVSAAAIVRRAYDLGLIGAAAYRVANVHIRQRGWHRGEPQEPPAERPELVPTVLALLEAGRGLGRDALAQRLGWSSSTFERIVGASHPPS